MVTAGGEKKRWRRELTLASQGMEFDAELVELAEQLVTLMLGL